jgi:NhaP-type Na+/H+ and K+/H+ antiporter
MNNKWDFSLYKLLLILCCGVVIGADLAWLTTDSISKIGAWAGILSMLLVATSVLVSSRIKEPQK